MDTSREAVHTQVTWRRVLTLTALAHVLVDGFGIGLSVLLALLFGREGQFALVGLVLSGYSLATAFAEPLWGRLSDTSGRRGSVVGWGLMLGTLAFAGMAFVVPERAGAAALLVALALVTGIGAGSYHGVATALVNEHVTSRSRGLIQGINNAGGSLGRSLMPLALTELALVLGSPRRAVLPVLALGLAVGAACVAFLPRAPAPARRDPSRIPTRRVLSSPLVARMVLLSFLRTAYFLTAVGFLPTYLVAVRGQSPALMGGVMSLVMATGIVAQPLGGRLSDFVDRLRLLGLLLVGSGVAFSAFLFVDGLAVSLILLGSAMFLLLMTFPLLFAVMGDAVPRDRLGVATGLVTGAGGLAATVTQLAVGTMAQRLPPGFVLAGLGALGILSGAVALSARGWKSGGQEVGRHGSAEAFP